MLEVRLRAKRAMVGTMTNIGQIIVGESLVPNYGRIMPANAWKS
jgi:hypothetical protein